MYYCVVSVDVGKMETRWWSGEDAVALEETVGVPGHVTETPGGHQN